MVKVKWWIEKRQSKSIVEATAKISYSKQEVKIPRDSNVFIVAMRHTDHLPARKYQPWIRESNFSRRRICVVIAPDKRVADCFRQTTCQNCHNYHHMSICDCEKPDNGGQTLIPANGNDKGIVPVLTIKVSGISCGGLINTGAGSWNASAKLKTRREDILISSEVKKLEA